MGCGGSSHRRTRRAPGAPLSRGAPQIDHWRRGHREDSLSNHKGNFLSILGFLAEFDRKLYLEKFSNPGKGWIYFPCVWGSKRRTVWKVKEAIYFSIKNDSTPDIRFFYELTFASRFANQIGDIEDGFFVL